MVKLACSNCSFENPSDALFCENCGQPLARKCWNCGHALTPTAKFCKNCGAAVTSSPDASSRTPLIPGAMRDDASPSPPLSRSTGEGIGLGGADARLTTVRQSIPPTLAQKMLAAGDLRAATLSTRGQTEGERKQVTVLFADVVGSTSLAERMDAEDWADIMNCAFERLLPAIYRYEGTVAQILGDGVLCFFGAPVSHDDDPIRAVRAALDLLSATHDYAAEVRQKYGIDFALRVGLNTGMVVVGRVGTDLNYEYNAIGDAVNLAARMQTAARPLTVLISENTFRLVAPAFECADLGAIQVKGKSKPVHVYEVVAERPGAPKRRGLVGLSSPMVGRDREFAALQRLTENLRAGHGGVVTILGEVGLGKSRLVAEWRDWTLDVGRWTGDVGQGTLDGVKPPNSASAFNLKSPEPRSAEISERSGDPALPAGRNPQSDIRNLKWLEGRCLSYGITIAYHLIMDLVRSLIGAAGGSSEEETRAALHHTIDRLFDSDDTKRREETYLYLAHLLSVSLEAEMPTRAASLHLLDAPALQTQYANALRLLLQRAAARSPTVIVCEDVHWADPRSVELLSRLLELAADSPLLFCIVMRPDYASPGWRLVTHAGELPGVGAMELHLAALSDADSQKLVRNLLHLGQLPESLRQLILTKAEGNPFFVEEVIRMLIDRGGITRDATNEQWLVTGGIQQIEIPDTLQSILAARIDQLPDEARRMLQVASVIGRQFTLQMFVAVLERQQQRG